MEITPAAQGIVRVDSVFGGSRLTFVADRMASGTHVQVTESCTSASRRYTIHLALDDARRLFSDEVLQALGIAQEGE